LIFLGLTLRWYLAVPTQDLLILLGKKAMKPSESLHLLLDGVESRN